MKFITPVILTALLVCGVFILVQQYKPIPAGVTDVATYFSSISTENRIAILPFDINSQTYGRFLTQSIINSTDTNYATYYSELNYAFRSRDIPLLNHVLTKYQISYIIVDKRDSNYSSIKSLLANDNDAELAMKGKNADIYHISATKQADTLISLTTDIPTIGIQNESLEKDIAYEENGLYRNATNNEEYDKVYPYIGLTGIVSSKGWQLHDEADHFFIVSNFNINQDNYSSNKAITHDVISFDTGEQIESDVEIAKIQIVDKQIILYFPKRELTKLHTDNAQEVACNAPSKKCYRFNLTQSHDDYGYMIAVNSTKNDNTAYYEALKVNGAIVDEGLNKSAPSHIIIPAISHSGKQYSIEVEKTTHFDNLLVYMFPYNELDSVRFTRTHKDIAEARLISNSSSEKIAPGLWSVSMMQALGDKPSTAILYMPYSQNYEAYQVTESWKWLPWTGKKLTGPVLVNGWANGWKIDNPTAIYDHSDNLIVIVDKVEYMKNMVQLGVLIVILAAVVIFMILLYKTKRS